MRITQINTLPPDETQQRMVQAQSASSGGSFHFLHRLASGEVRPVEVHTGPIRMHGKEFLYSLIHEYHPDGLTPGAGA
jgi:hypothetical protein